MGACASKNELGANTQGERTDEVIKLPHVHIYNTTEKTIALRDRDREVYGVLRHEVLPGKDLRVPVNLKDAGTYYRMAVLVMQDSEKNMVEPTNPPLFIDTEDLHSHKSITISFEGGKYVLKKRERKPDNAAEDLHKKN